MTRPRTLLIVEDDPDFRKLFKIALSIAIERIRRELPTIYEGLPEGSLATRDLEPFESIVLEVSSEAEAEQAIIDHPDLTFASVDMALTQAEMGGSNAGGMRVLKHIHEIREHTLVVVVSAEMNIDYATDSYQRYKVLAFHQKARFVIEDYQRTVLAALWYAESAHLLSRIERYEADPDSLDIAQACWERAVATLTRDGLPIPINFPEDLGLRMQVLRSGLHPITRRPNGEWTNQILKSRVIGAQDWSVICVLVSDYAAFRANYPSQIDALLFMIAAKIKENIPQNSQAPTFIGMLGQEYRADPCFVVVLDGQSKEALTAIIQNITESFAANAMTLLPYRERDQVEKRAKLHTRIWTSQIEDHQYDFSDIHAAIDILSTA